MKILFFTACLIGPVIFCLAEFKEKANDKFVKEISKLAQNKSISAAFSEIDRLNATTLKELILLTEIPAPPFKEEVRAKKFKQMLEEAGGAKVWIDSVGNVLALRKGTKGERVVAINGHLDTAFPEGTDVTVKMMGDTLFAPELAIALVDLWWYRWY